MPSTGAVVATGTANAPVGLPSTVPPAIAVRAPAGILFHVARAADPVSLPQNLFAGACVPHCANAPVKLANVRNRPRASALRSRIGQIPVSVREWVEDVACVGRGDHNRAS